MFRAGLTAYSIERPFQNAILKRCALIRRKFRTLKLAGLSISRVSQGYAKDHWIDAACVGESGGQVTIAEGHRALHIKAAGRGTRQVVRTDQYGFPRGKAGRCKRVKGFQTGDRVRLTQPRGKCEGTHTGILASIRANGTFDIKAKVGKISANWKNFKLIQRGDGYDYSLSVV